LKYKTLSEKGNLLYENGKLKGKINTKMTKSSFVLIFKVMYSRSRRCLESLSLSVHLWIIRRPGTYDKKRFFNSSIVNNYHFVDFTSGGLMDKKMTSN